MFGRGARRFDLIRGLACLCLLGVAALLISADLESLGFSSRETTRQTPPTNSLPVAVYSPLT